MVETTTASEAEDHINSHSKNYKQYQSASALTKIRKAKYDESLLEEYQPLQLMLTPMRGENEDSEEILKMPGILIFIEKPFQETVQYEKASWKFSSLKIF